MKGLSLSGGATKISGIYGAAKELIKEKGYKPDIISGVSAGSILALPITLGLWDNIESLLFNLKLSDFMSCSPVKKNGNFSLIAKWRFITGKRSLGKMDNLTKTLSKVITPKMFDLYKMSNKPPIIVGTVDYKTGGRFYYDIKKLSYDNYLKIVKASSSIPIYVDAVEFSNKVLYDGGVRDHIGSEYLYENFNLSEHVSIFSRPEDYKLKDNPLKNIPDITFRTLEILNLEISKSDERIEHLLAEKYNVKFCQIFMKSIMEGYYDVDNNRLITMSEIGKNATKKYYKN